MEHKNLLKLSRFEALTDGVFAIAMTILILDLHLPLGLGISQLNALLQNEILERILIYGGSFLILGTQWIAMNFQQGFLERINRPYLWANIFYLMIIGVIPFSASLIALYPNSYASILFYALNLIFANAGQALTWYCSHYFKLNGDVYTPYARKVVSLRIAVAPIFYIASLFIGLWSPKLAFLALIAPPLIYIIPGKVDSVENQRD